MDEAHPARRVIGINDLRFDGLSDLLLRAQGCSVIDIGCNKGHVAYEFYIHNARLVHGCDIYAPGIMAARQWFAELGDCESKFEVVDLEKPGAMAEAFGSEGYDIVLLIGVYHKLVRVMAPQALSDLMRDLGKRSLRYFGWNGYPEHLMPIDIDLGATGLKRIHTSEIARPGRPAAIWRRD